MTKQPPLPPEQQIANVERALAELRQSKRYRGRAEAIRCAERHLANLVARHERGELQPIVDDGLPF